MKACKGTFPEISLSRSVCLVYNLSTTGVPLIILLKIVQIRRIKGQIVDLTLTDLFYFARIKFFMSVRGSVIMDNL